MNRWGWGLGLVQVRLALLSLLGEAPGHGYDLMRRLRQRSAGLYRAGADAVYPVLRQLEDEGLIRSDEVDGKKVYEITEEGRAELARQAEAVEGIWRRARGWREWGFRLGSDTIEVASAVGRTTRAAFAAAGDVARARRVIDILNRARVELEGVR